MKILILRKKRAGSLFQTIRLFCVDLSLENIFTGILVAVYMLEGVEISHNES